MHLEIVGDGATVVSDVVEEIQKSMIKHPLFNSAHEDYGVLLEELDELWDEVKKKKSARDVKNMRAEAVQVAAMAMKFIMSMENDWKSGPMIESEEEMLASEAKFLQCKYTILTDEELAKLEADPCNTCRDLCNWQLKEVKLDGKT